MKFGEAVAALKEGKRVARAGWNGKGMWICYMPPVTIPAGMVNARTRQFYPEGDLSVGGYFVIWTAQKTWQPGWHPSQLDVLADDWAVIE